jgi:predicted SAM-dependent methyltransferase
MKYLNLGCGAHYSTKEEWTNIDFVSTGRSVIAHNLLKGVPFENNTFDLVYHSHVLEHFSKIDGENFIAECFRVLKPGGVIRIAIPDLEQIVRNYLRFLEEGVQNPNDILIRANYEWMLIEMYDQTVRNVSGGNMVKYLFQEKMPNEDFVFQRIGEEGRAIRNIYLTSKNNNPTTNRKPAQVQLVRQLKNKIINFLIKKLHINMSVYEIGKFRISGEIHQWMYDRYSLSNLLLSNTAINIVKRDAFTSYISNWVEYDIDGKQGVTRKPDSLFIEAIKQ